MRTQSIDPKITKVFQSIDMNTYEVLVHEMYHIKTLAGKADGTVNIASELSYFALKTGQPDDNGLPTTYEDTNMDSAGQIGTPYRFWGQYLSAFVLPAKASPTPAVGLFDKANPQAMLVNDAARILNRGVVTVSVLNQPIIRIAPICGIPAGLGVTAAPVFGFDVDVAGMGAQNGWAVGSNKYPIDLYLENQLTFDFKVSFPSGVFALYNTLRLGFKIQGFLIRPRQGGGAQ